MQQAAASPYNASQEGRITQLRCRPAMPENKPRERVASGTGALLPRRCPTRPRWPSFSALHSEGPISPCGTRLGSPSEPAQPRRAGNLSAVPFCPKDFLALALSVRESSKFSAQPAEKTDRRANSQRPVCPGLPSPRGTEPARTSSIISIAHPSSAPSSPARPLPARHSPVRHDVSCAAYARSPAPIMPPSNSFKRATSHCLSATGCYDGNGGHISRAPVFPQALCCPRGYPYPEENGEGAIHKVYSLYLLRIRPL